MKALTLFQAFLLLTALSVSAPALADNAGTNLEAAVEINKGEIEATCSAICDDGGQISCTGDACNAENSNCDAGVQGHVECDGTYTYCGLCKPVPECIENDRKFIFIDECCAENGQYQRFYRCINGQWVYQGLLCKPVIHCEDPMPQ